MLGVALDERLDKSCFANLYILNTLSFKDGGHLLHLGDQQQRQRWGALLLADGQPGERVTAFL